MPTPTSPPPSTSGNERLKDLVDFLARNLVERPDEVDVRDVEEEDELVIELIVAEEDLGKVIGREGRTARAMRTVLNAAASRLNRRVALEILE